MSMRSGRQGWRHVAHLLILTLIVALSHLGSAGVVARASDAYTPCGAAPSGALTAEQVDAFVSTWASRVQDSAYFETYINDAATSAATLDPTYANLDSGTESFLVNCLGDALAEQMQERGLSHDLPGTAELAQAKQVLLLLLFNKAALTSGLTPPSSPDQSAAGPQSGATPTQAAVAKVDGAFDLAEGATAPPLPKASDETIPVSPQALITKGQLNTLPAFTASAQDVPAPPLNVLHGAPTPASTTIDPTALLTSATASVSGIADSLRGAIATIAAVLPGAAAAATAHTSASRVNSPRAGVTPPAVSSVVPEGATYRLCVQSAKVNACQAAPLGAPFPTDVSGDSVPDVTVALTPGAAVSTPKLSAPADAASPNLTLEVDRLPADPIKPAIGPATGPLPAYIYIAYDVPGLAKRIEFGFDASASTLATKSRGVLQLNSITQYNNGNLQAHLELTHTAPGATETDTFGVKDVVGNDATGQGVEANPQVGALQMSPVPATLTADISQPKRTATNETIDASLSTSATTSLVFALDQAMTTTSPQTHEFFAGALPQLPPSLSVHYNRQGDEVAASYNVPSGQGLSAASLFQAIVPDVANHPQSNQVLAVVASGLPAQLTADIVGIRHATFTASAGIADVAAARSFTTDGVVMQYLAAHATGAPSQLTADATLSSADTIGASLSANGRTATASVLLYDRPDQQTFIGADLTGVPANLSLALTPSRGLVQYSSDSPITNLVASISRNGGAVPQVTGEHVALVEAGGVIGASVSVAGLKAASIDPSTSLSASLTDVPDGNPFQLYADIDKPNVVAYGALSALPAQLTATVHLQDGTPTAGTAHIDTGGGLAAAFFGYVNRDSGESASAYGTSLPATIDITYVSGSQHVLTYAASGPAGGFGAGYRNPASGLALDAAVTDVPNWVQARFFNPLVVDARTSANADPGSAALGKVTALFTTNGTYQKAPTTGDHLLVDFGSQGLLPVDADLQYQGVRLAQINVSGASVSADLLDSAKQSAAFYITTPSYTQNGIVVPSLNVTAAANGIPTSLHVDADTSQYVAHLRANASLDAFGLVAQATSGGTFNSTGDTVVAFIDTVPSVLTLSLVPATPSLSWTANAATGKALVGAVLSPPGLAYPIAAYASAASIPASFTVSGHLNASDPLSGSHLTLAAAGVFTSPDIEFSTTGKFLAAIAGTHLVGLVDRPSGTIQASLALDAVSSIDITADGSDNHVDIHGSAAKPTTVALIVHAGGTDDIQLSAFGAVGTIPSRLYGAVSTSQIEVDAPGATNLQLGIGIGNTAAVAATAQPQAATYDSINVTDHTGSCADRCPGFKITTALTYVPDSITLKFAPFAVSATNVRTSGTGNDVLNIDIQDSAVLPAPTHLLASLSSLKPGTGLSLHDVSFSDVGDDLKAGATVEVTGSSTGRLLVTAVYGSLGTFNLEADDIPAGVNTVSVEYSSATRLSMMADATFGGSVPGAEFDFTEAGHDLRFPDVLLTMQQIPQKLHLNVNSIAGYYGCLPGFGMHYAASGANADNLDVQLSTSLSAKYSNACGVVGPHGAGAGPLALTIKNLGHATDAIFGPDGILHVTSVPSTSELRIEGTAELTGNFDFTQDFPVTEIPILKLRSTFTSAYDAKGHTTIDAFGIRSLNIKPNYALNVSGDYDRVDWYKIDNGQLYSPGTHVGFDLVFDLFITSYTLHLITTPDFASFTLNTPLALRSYNANFHQLYRFTQTDADIATAATSAACSVATLGFANCSFPTFEIDTRPTGVKTTDQDGSPEISTYGGAPYLIVPSLGLPNFLVDVASYDLYPILSADGGLPFRVKLD